MALGDVRLRAQASEWLDELRPWHYTVGVVSWPEFVQSLITWGEAEKALNKGTMTSGTWGCRATHQQANGFNSNFWSHGHKYIAVKDLLPIVLSGQESGSTKLQMQQRCGGANCWLQQEKVMLLMTSLFWDNILLVAEHIPGIEK